MAHPTTFLPRCIECRVASQEKAVRLSKGEAQKTQNGLFRSKIALRLKKVCYKVRWRWYVEVCCYVR